ncbi:NADH dehydrogenase [ubiquinone] 1 beta subcomplex subunit 10 [Onthophagus taurus]|uniref:NADH dehydrogenase [ubiquinone] 1 beta subcomplex subunit 10 n=1 Tax=Onthophagus taurus TaxID=166361 RepID=UPI0039BE2DEE
MPEAQPRNVIERFFNNVYKVLEGPTVWVRENIVEPNQKQYPWYHEKMRRVPTVDECYTDDVACYFEANCQYKRDRLVDTEIINILRQRFEECNMYEQPDHIERCAPIRKDYEEASTNWFTKYGDLGAYHNVRSAYMKQKHRMIWERRHGPVGSGMKKQEEEE